MDKKTKALIICIAIIVGLMVYSVITYSLYIQGVLVGQASIINRINQNKTIPIINQSNQTQIIWIPFQLSGG